MFTTTDYGSWSNHGDKGNVSVEASIADAVSGGDSEWLESMEAAGAFEKIASDYRDAIQEALPEGVYLTGNEFIGPAYAEDRKWDGDLDLTGRIKGIDLYKFVQRHDVDNTETLTQFTWADTPKTAWALVHLRESDDGEWLAPYVHETRESADASEVAGRTDVTLYRVTRTSVLADETTAAPEGEDWVFTYSTPERPLLWNKPNCYSPWPDRKRFDDLSWTYAEPVTPMERAAMANEEPRTRADGLTFRAYLLTWSVDVVTSQN